MISSANTSRNTWKGDLGASLSRRLADEWNPAAAEPAYSDPLADTERARREWGCEELDRGDGENRGRRDEGGDMRRPATRAAGKMRYMVEMAGGEFEVTRPVTFLLRETEGDCFVTRCDAPRCQYKGRSPSEVRRVPVYGGEWEGFDRWRAEHSHRGTGWDACIFISGNRNIIASRS